MKTEVKITRRPKGNKPTRIAKAVAAAAVQVESGAKTNINAKNIIDTGALLGSIQQDVISRFVRHVGNQKYTNYGAYHEFGTRYIKARPFLIPAATQVRPRFIANIIRILND